MDTRYGIIKRLQPLTASRPRPSVPALPSPPRTRGFAAFAWGILAYNLGVILWGAYVRASGAGNGCGDNWPLCDNQFLPSHPQLKMLIEFLHRVSSGVDGILIALLWGLALWLYPRRHRVRRAASFGMLFLITEALLGAGLVLFGWVGQNASPARVAADSLHLVNTLFLLASVLLTAAWASGLPAFRLRGRGRPTFLLITAVAGFLVTGICGVMAALADTLFPSASLAAGLRQDFTGTGQLLQRLRVIHPAVAVLFGLFLLYLVVEGIPRPVTPLARRLGFGLAAAVLTQWSLGVLDIAFLTPIWLQMLHLLVADLLWLTLLLFAAATLSSPN